MVGEIDFVYVNVNCIAFPTPEKFDIVARDPIRSSRNRRAFPDGVTGEAGGRNAGTQKHFLDFVVEILSAEWAEGARKQWVRGVTVESSEKHPKCSDRAQWG